MSFWYCAPRERAAQDHAPRYLLPPRGELVLIVTDLVLQRLDRLCGRSARIHGRRPLLLEPPSLLTTLIGADSGFELRTQRLQTAGTLCTPDGPPWRSAGRASVARRLLRPPPQARPRPRPHPAPVDPGGRLRFGTALCASPVWAASDFPQPSRESSAPRARVRATLPAAPRLVAALWSRVLRVPPLRRFSAYPRKSAAAGSPERRSVVPARRAASDEDDAESACDPLHAESPPSPSPNDPEALQMLSPQGGDPRQPQNLKAIERYVMHFDATLQSSSVRRIYERMVFSGQSIPLTVYNRAITAYNMLGQPERGERVFERILQEGSAPNERSFLSLLLLYSRHGRARAFTPLYRHAREVYGRSNPQFHVPALFLYGSTGALAELRECLAWMERCGLSLPPFGLRAAMRALAKGRQYSEAAACFRRHGRLEARLLEALPDFVESLLRLGDLAGVHSLFAGCLEQRFFHPLLLRPFFAACSARDALPALDEFLRSRYQEQRPSDVEFCATFPFLLLPACLRAPADASFARELIARRGLLRKPLSTDSLTALAVLDQAQFPEAAALLEGSLPNASKRTAILFKDALHRLREGGRAESVRRLYELLRATHGVLFARDATLLQCAAERPELDWSLALDDFRASFRPGGACGGLHIILFHAARACCLSGRAAECVSYWIHSFLGLQSMRQRLVPELEDLYRRLLAHGDPRLTAEVLSNLRANRPYFPTGYSPSFSSALLEAAAPASPADPAALFRVLFREADLPSAPHETPLFELFL